MRKVTFYIKKYFTAEGHAQIDRERAARSTAATSSNPNSGTSTPSSRSGRHGQEAYEWPSGGNPTRSHRPPPSGVTVSDRPIGQQRQRRTRRRRRTASPVGLPIYSEEPRDQEMSLFKHQTTDLSMSSSRLDLALSPTIEVDNGSDEEEDEDEEDHDEPPRGHVDSASESVRPSFDNSTLDHDGGVPASHTDDDTRIGGLLPPPASRSPLAPPNRPRSASESLVRMSSRNPYGSHSSSPFASRSGLIDLPPGQLSPTVSRDGTSTPPLPGTPRSSFFLGHRTTRSSPISAMARRRASSPPRPNFGGGGGVGGNRPRASTLQRVLGGSANSSSGFLPIGGATGAASPYGHSVGGSRSGSPSASGANSPAGGRSLRRFATGSTTSVNTLDISEPVPGSFVHSSFVFPRNGPTPEQVKFIASRENLGAYGYFGENPPAFDEGSSPPPSTSSLSPLVDGVGGITLARPISTVQATPTGRGRSGSSASSPLARRASPSPPPRRRSREEDARDRDGLPRHSLAQEATVPDQEEGDEDESGDDGDMPFTVDEEEEEFEESNTSTELPQIAPVSPISFEIAATIATGAALSSSADSHPYPSTMPPPFNRLNTSSPPPPRIVTHSATPTHSACPSPALPQAGFDEIKIAT